jgi:hypothetical protein
MSSGRAGCLKKREPLKADVERDVVENMHFALKRFYGGKGKWWMGSGQGMFLIIQC